MSAVAISELKERTSAVLRRVREQRETIDVTYRGEVVARITPVPPPIDPEVMKEVWARHDQLAEEIGKLWPEGLSAADAIAEDRE